MRYLERLEDKRPLTFLVVHSPCDCDFRSAAIIGDVNGDGTDELGIVQANRTDGELSYLVAGQSIKQVLPIEEADSFFAQSSFDFDGDGTEDAYTINRGEALYVDIRETRVQGEYSFVTRVWETLHDIRFTDDGIVVMTTNSFESREVNAHDIERFSVRGIEKLLPPVGDCVGGFLCGASLVVSPEGVSVTDERPPDPIPTKPLEFDFNGDGVFDTVHFTPHSIDVVLRIDEPILPGDANGDSNVDFQDFLILSRNFGGRGNGASDGDFDADGHVGFQDFLILARFFGIDTRTDSSLELPLEL